MLCGFMPGWGACSDVLAATLDPKRFFLGPKFTGSYPNRPRIEGGREGECRGVNNWLTPA